MLGLMKQAMANRGAVGAGMMAGLRGQVGRMPSQMFAGGYKAGLGARNLASNRTVQGAMAGGAIGAATGENTGTGFLGGAIMGGAGMRYGGAAMRNAKNYMSGKGPVSARGLGLNMRMGVQDRMAADFRGARMAANQGFTKIKGLHTT